MSSKFSQADLIACCFDYTSRPWCSVFYMLCLDDVFGPFFGICVISGSFREQDQYCCCCTELAHSNAQKLQPCNVAQRQYVLLQTALRLGSSSYVKARGVHLGEGISEDPLIIGSMQLWAEVSS